MKNGHFWTKTMGKPLWKNVNFLLLWTLCFYSLERRFFVRQYHKRHFPGLYCLKKKVAKMAIFIPTSWVTPLEKCQFSTFWTLCFCSLERRFLVLEYNKRHFPELYCQKKKVGKMAIFRPKPWVNPFGIVAIFWLFELYVFIA